VFGAIHASLKSFCITLKGTGEPGSSYFVDLATHQNGKNGTWDVGHPGWYPYWYGPTGRTIISPLFQPNCVLNTNQLRVQ